MSFTKLKVPVLTLLILPALGGCAKLAHLEQLLCIKSYSENRDIQLAYVDLQNENFDRLLAAVNAGEIQPGIKKQDLVEKFGEPVIHRPVMGRGGAREEWLYRYATVYFNTEKIYMYFGEDGRMISLQHEIPPEDSTHE